MSGIIDISVPLHESMPVWPGSSGFRLQQTMRIGLDGPANVSRLECDLHAGTHVDAPLHFIEAGAAVDALALDVLTGPALVADLTGPMLITARHLGELNLPAGTRRLLLRTRNSERRVYELGGFQEDFVALSADAAQWVADHRIELIGVDYLSVQPFGGSPRTHQVLLGAGIVVVEGLNLADVAPGPYHFICLPIALVGAEGAPARAVLIAEGDSPPAGHHVNGVLP